MLDEKKVVELAERINKRKEGKDSYAATYLDTPDLKELARIADENNSNDEASLSLLCDIYTFLSEQYESMGRFSVAGAYRAKALLNAKALRENKVNPTKLNDWLRALLRDRNFYVDDDCEDVRELVKGLIADGVIEKLFKDRMSNRRSLTHDPVEMSEEYLKVIDEVEELVEKNRTMKGMGSCFEIWDLKEKFLLERGIEWKSPSMLNPHVMFD
jgi:hypothetical protein